MGLCRLKFKTRRQEALFYIRWCAVNGNVEKVAAPRVQPQSLIYFSIGFQMPPHFPWKMENGISFTFENRGKYITITGVLKKQTIDRLISCQIGNLSIVFICLVCFFFFFAGDERSAYTPFARLGQMGVYAVLSVVFFLLSLIKSSFQLCHNFFLFHLLR